MTAVFFTADTHFGHKNIVHIGKGRPWPDVEEMNESLIERWNTRVRQQDLIYHLGDFSFGNPEFTEGVIRRLNGQVHVIRGNHDKVLDRLIKKKPDLVVSYQDYKEIKIAGQRLVLFHFPILSWHQAHHGAWHLHGHSHGNLNFQNGPMLDVGVDSHNYAPITFEEIRVIIEGKEDFKGYDHHA